MDEQNNNQGPAPNGNPEPRPGWENNENSDNTGPAPFSPGQRTAADLTFDFMVRGMLIESKDEVVRVFRGIAADAFCKAHQLWHQTLTTSDQIPVEPILLSPQNAAKMLDVCTKTLEKYPIRKVTLLTGHTRYLKADIDKMIQDGLAEAEKNGKENRKTDDKP